MKKKTTRKMPHVCLPPIVEWRDRPPVEVEKIVYKTSGVFRIITAVAGLACIVAGIQNARLRERIATDDIFISSRENSVLVGAPIVDPSANPWRVRCQEAWRALKRHDEKEAFIILDN